MISNLRYFPHYDPKQDGWFVAYARPNGQLMLAVDVANENRAIHEATQLNRQARQQAQADRNARLRKPVAGFYTGQGDL